MEEQGQDDSCGKDKIGAHMEALSVIKLKGDQERLQIGVEGVSENTRRVDCHYGNIQGQ